MASSYFVVLLAAALVAQLVSAGVVVNQYEGPKECDRKTQPGDFLTMHYTGTIDKSSKGGKVGFEFDSSWKGGGPFGFRLGIGRVIRGWEEGLSGLCQGAKATLVITPDYAYGDEGNGEDIPPGSTLHFDVELVRFKGPPNVFDEIDGHPDADKPIKDSVLTEDEFMAFFEEQDKKMPENMVKELDKDGDGKVSWEEFTGPKGERPLYPGGVYIYSKEGKAIRKANGELVSEKETDKKETTQSSKRKEL